ncbi:MAG: hypothetical protein HC831_18750 [Chloroflexia bacterium]|nr:hypothetical protein [Chloroflexia bacterium]
MGCKLSFILKREMGDEDFDKFRQFASSSNSKLEGDKEQGKISIKISFIGSITGDYNISGKNLFIEITKRPKLVSCVKIESEIKSFLKENDLLE